MESGKSRDVNIHDIDLEQFGRDRADFISRYGNRKSSDSIFESIGSDTTVYRLQHPEKRSNESFDRKTRIALHEFLYPPQASLSLYDQLAKSFNQSPGDRDNIRQFYGKYHVFRYAPSRKGPVYRPGEIELLESLETGEPTFHHWSGDFDRTRRQDAEHTGFVFHHSSKLYFAGRRRGVMRLGIVKTDEEPKSELCMAGLILSVSTEQQEPFAAKLLLVPFENAALAQELDQGVVGNVGEKRFRELTETSESDAAILTADFKKSTS